MSLLRRLAAVSLPALAAFWVLGLGSASPVAAGDPPPNPTKPDPAMGDPVPPAGGAVPPAGGAVPPAAGAVPPGPAPKVHTLDEAKAEVGHLKEYLKNAKSSNEDMLASLDAVELAYHNLAADVPEKDKEEFQKEAEKAFLIAFEKVRIKNKVNERDEVNKKAIQILGRTGSPRSGELTDKIIQVLETQIFKAKEYDPPSEIYDESFKAIALLNEKVKGFDWMVKNYTRYDNSPNAPEKTKAAFDAVILFKNIKGLDRQTFVKDEINNWLSVENGAEINKDKTQRAQKPVWDKLKPSVIKALQVYAGEPKDKAGSLIATVKGLKAWFDDHDKAHDPAFADAKAPKPAKEPPK